MLRVRLATGLPPGTQLGPGDGCPLATPGLQVGHVRPCHTIAWRPLHAAHGFVWRRAIIRIQCSRTGFQRGGGRGRNTCISLSHVYMCVGWGVVLWPPSLMRKRIKRVEIYLSRIHNEYSNAKVENIIISEPGDYKTEIVIHYYYVIML